jgi:hypothetical protein
VKKLEFVLVEWWDAYSSDAPATKSADDRGIATVSAGFLVEKTKYGVRLAMIAHLYEDFPEYRVEHFIPHGMVRKIIRTGKYA